jgi:hypothetical protein
LGYNNYSFGGRYLWVYIGCFASFNVIRLSTRRLVDVGSASVSIAFELLGDYDCQHAGFRSQVARRDIGVDTVENLGLENQL